METETNTQENLTQFLSIKPVIIGRNDGCLICDDLGYICEDCLVDYFNTEIDNLADEQENME